MSRTLADSRRWVAQGTELISASLEDLGEDDYAVACALPGWTRKHLVAHLAANADAIGNLVNWAATGEPTPMYASKEQRAADIEEGSQQTAGELTNRFVTSADVLKVRMDDLSDEQWDRHVQTAQGRTVPASETAWMRAREVMVHAVDLQTSVGFEDLPADFLTALCDDIVAKRGAGDGPAVHLEADDADLTWKIAGDGEAIRVAGNLAAITAYLAGREASGLSAANADGVPELPVWL